MIRIYCGDMTGVEEFEELSTSHATTTTTTTSSRRRRSNSYKTPSPPLESITKTPTTLRSIRQEVTIVRSSRVELSPTIDRLLRGALHNAEKGALASAALVRMMGGRSRPSNSSRSKRQVKLDGPVYVGDIRRHISAENKASIERCWRSTAKIPREENRALMS
jgi:hypothetical protein